MSGNSSSSSNDSNLPLDTFFIVCLVTRPGSTIFIIYCITNTLLLLPLCTFILYPVLQRWRQQRSTTTATTSHSDVFTYHMVTMELLGVLGLIICFSSDFSGHVYPVISLLGYIIWYFTWYGEIFFHTLTCLERYLAVVHAITYMKLRGERGIRIRNISIGCVWLLSIGGCSLMIFGYIQFLIDISLLFISFILVSFCSVSVLCVLIRPGPGEQGGVRKRVDQSKQRAFYTIMAILGALFSRFVLDLTILVLFLLKGQSMCGAVMICIWFNMPCSLLLPLLYLHRAGKFACCKNNIK